MRGKVDVGSRFFLDLLDGSTATSCEDTVKLEIDINLLGMESALHWRQVEKIYNQVGGPRSICEKRLIRSKMEERAGPVGWLKDCLVIQEVSVDEAIDTEQR